MPDLTPIHPERVVQTHASIVLLDAERAYKIKKPVHFPFLDYSTIERRRRFCFEELHQNRRFAPDWYLGVAHIKGHPDNPQVGPLMQDAPDADTPGLDYAVVMRRVPDEAWLSRRLATGTLEARHLDALMHHLTEAWHEPPPGTSAEDLRDAGMPVNLRSNTVANIAECKPFVPECMAPQRWQRLDDLLRGWFEANPEIFIRRARDGFIRDGHGDLKPSNVAFVDDAPVVTDCIEFNPQFRRLDTLCEAAFLATGLESLGAFDTAARVFDAYRMATGDDYPEALRRYYQAHLACVMGKVTALQLADEGISAADRDRARALARHCFALADFHAREPHVVIVGGIMGCGKSTVAEAIARATGLPLVSSDVERKRLFGVAPTDRLPPEAYNDETANRVYQTLFDAAKSCGTGVILDGMFPTREYRRLAAEAARARGGAATLVFCDAPDDIITARMRQRELDPSRVSDATADLLPKARARFQPPDADEDLVVLHHDTRDPPEGAVAALLQALLGPDYNPDASTA